MAATTAPRLALRGRRSRLAAPLLTVGVIAVGALALHLRDPHQAGSWGWCPFKLLTGWDCPACGCLRAVNDLGDRHLSDAWHSNPLFVASVPLVAAGWAWWLWRSWAGKRGGPGRSGRWSGVALAAYGVVALAVTVWRNTPAGAAFHVS